MFAQNVSLAGMLFVYLLFALMIVLGGPLDKLLRKIFKGNDKIILICGLCVIALIASYLTNWITPMVEDLFRKLFRFLRDLLY